MRLAAHYCCHKGVMQEWCISWTVFTHIGMQPQVRQESFLYLPLYYYNIYSTECSMAISLRKDLQFLPAQHQYKAIVLTSDSAWVEWCVSYQVRFNLITRTNRKSRPTYFGLATEAPPGLLEVSICLKAAMALLAPPAAPLPTTQLDFLIAVFLQ